MHSDYFYAADDALHSARKFTHFWGAVDDRTYAGRHGHQAVLCALKGRAEIMGCRFDTSTTDLMEMLEIIQARDASFLSSRRIPESAILAISKWQSLSIYDNKPAPTKEQLLTAISVGEKLSVVVVDLMDTNVEPTDEQLFKLTREMGKVVPTKNH